MANTTDEPEEQERSTKHCIGWAIIEIIIAHPLLHLSPSTNEGQEELAYSTSDKG